MNAQACFVPASDTAFSYEGRIDRRDPAGPVLIWQGSRVQTAFEGDRLVLDFGRCRGACFFDLDVDGARSVIAVPEGAGPLRLECAVGLAPGWHKMTLTKRSEADAGYVVFQGIGLVAGARTRAVGPTPARLALQFFGDSITVGACNEDGAEDQWENRATHNNALSYAALTAQALQARYRNIAVSGMGIVVGYVPKRAGQIWDRLYPEVDSPKADEAGWLPDVVFVNYGENDDSFTRNNGQAFPEGYSDGYVLLVREMRRAYPRAEIVLLRGGMFCGAKSEPLRLAWEDVVRRLEAGDAHVHHFVFTRWAQTHPRVDDHKAMAAELTTWLRQQAFLRGRL